MSATIVVDYDVLISAQQLIDRLRHPRSRADEVASVRRRLTAQAADAGTPEEASTAKRLRALRQELAGALAGVRSCASCATGYPFPHGRWDGGHCCGGRTDGVFTDDEVAALALGGTTPASLRLPSGDHAGCAFRGPTGCSLEPRDRPNVCVRYTCRGLEKELVARGDRKPIAALQEELRRELARFVASRAARLTASAEASP